MPMFEQASQFMINGSSLVNNETTTNITNNGVSELQYLYKHAARGASHDSKDQYELPKCHPDTRKQLLDDIHEWIKSPDKKTGILYLHGPAGAGKSCIARSACEQATKEGLLGASFFFRRGSSSRDNDRQLISTLAYQLAKGNKELASYIFPEIKENPDIFDRPLEIQFRKLIRDPCCRIPREKLPVRAIVIDGLDECMDEMSQTGILRTLARAVRYEGFPIGFFVTSRPELHLQEVLDSKEIIFATNIISLYRTAGISQDIRTVLESGFTRILNTPRFKKAFKSILRPWPSPENIDKLVRRSSGQFIYAATVLKFVSAPDNNPASQLEILLQIKDSIGSSPFADLDLLYQQILFGATNQGTTLKVLSYMLAIKDLAKVQSNGELHIGISITRFFLHNQNRLLLAVEQLLELPDGMAYLALNHLHSLISIKVGSESTRRHLEIDFYHKSFEDFLTTKGRSANFYIDLGDVHAEVAKSCLKYLGNQTYETVAQHVGWLYSCFQWSAHNRRGLRKVDINDFEVGLQRFFLCPTPPYYLHHSRLKTALEILGILGKDGNQYFISGKPYMGVAIRNLETYATLSFEDLTHMVNDCNSSFDVRHPVATTLCFGIPRRHIEELARQNQFRTSYVYPVWRRYLQTFNNVSLVKKMIVSHHLTVSGRIISESEKRTMFQALALISGDKADERTVLEQFMDLDSRLEYFTHTLPMKDFLCTFEFSETFYCTREDFSDVYTAIISTGIWRNHSHGFFSLWASKTTASASATDSLLACLISEALEYRDDVELTRQLDRDIERWIFTFLSEKLHGQTEDVINEWSRTFDKSHSLFPEKFY